MEKRKPCCGKTQAHLRTVLASRYRCGVRELEVMLDERFKKKNNNKPKPTKRHCLSPCRGCRPRLTDGAQRGARLGCERGWGHVWPRREINPLPSAPPPPQRSHRDGVKSRGGHQQTWHKAGAGTGAHDTARGETGGLKRSDQQRTPEKQLQDVHRRCCGLR